MKILITGSRDWTDIKKIFEVLTKEVKPGDIIIHGAARGADSIANFWAIDHKIEVIAVPPIYKDKTDYYKHRSAEMVGVCDRVIAFWDGKSPGTWFTMDYAIKRNKTVLVIRQ